MGKKHELIVAKLQKRIEHLDIEIFRWKPPTHWTANKHSLGWLQRKRKELTRVLDRLNQKNKEITS